jgi:polyisoprenyl-phosphate glycosyltransferase
MDIHNKYPNPASRPDLSIVIPIYNEQSNIPILYDRLSKTLKSTGISYEIIFIDDGSKDKSRELLKELSENHAQVIYAELARNFGQQIAISAGLELASGNAVMAMDADLQDPPESIPQFLQKLNEGYDVVYAIRTKRKEKFLKRCCYNIFYKILRTIANIEIPLDSGDFCIMSRKIVNLINEMPERNRFVRGIRSWVGFKQIGIEIERDPRFSGDPGYTLTKLIFLALDGLVSFSYVPLRLITMVGFAVSGLSFVLTIYYGFRKIFYDLQPQGFATIVVMISFFAGVQLITIGVIGEYVGRIFEEVKRRPLYVLRSLRGGRFGGSSNP